MSYKSPDQQRLFQKEWAKKRLEQWVKDHGPCSSCGSSDSLKRVRKTYAAKRVSPTSKREKSNEKYMVLCEPCAKSRISKSLSRRAKSNPEKFSRPKKLTAEKVKEILEMVAGGINPSKVSRYFGLHRGMVGVILRGEAWAHVTGFKPKLKKNSKGGEEDDRKDNAEAEEPTSAKE